jgi:hypothetical protein
MVVTLESTSKIVEIVVDGVPVRARIWQGQTAAGVPCHAYITRIAVAKDAHASEFDRELQEMAAPRAELAALPARLVLG